MNTKAQDHQGDTTRLRAPVTDRVNVEPAIIRGMTMTEAKVISMVTVPLFLVIGAILMLITGWWQLVLALGIAGPLACLWIGSGYLQGFKRGRPDGYYTQAIHLWMAKRGWVENKFISHHGEWDLGRTLEFTLAHPFEAGSKPPSSTTTSESKHP